MRRHWAPALVLLSAIALLGAGCSDSKPGAKVISPVPGDQLVTVTAPKGNPARGATVFKNNGCGACHTFTPAGATGKIGPNLDNLAAYAQKAGQPIDEFTSAAITAPPASYVPPGYPTNVMPTTFSSLSPQSLADLVAFLTQGH
jgi:cytochrome c551/c552